MKERTKRRIPRDIVHRCELHKQARLVGYQLRFRSIPSTRSLWDNNLVRTKLLRNVRGPLKALYGDIDIRRGTR